MKRTSLMNKVAVESYSHNSTKKRKLRDRISLWNSFPFSTELFKKSNRQKSSLWQDAAPQDVDSQGIEQDNFPLGTFWC